MNPLINQTANAASTPSPVMAKGVNSNSELLNAAVAQLHVALKEAKNALVHAQAQGPTPRSKDSLNKAMKLLIEAMGALQGELMKATQKINEMDVSNNKAFLAQASITLKDTEKQVKETLSQIDDESFWGTLGKWLIGALEAIAGICALFVPGLQAVGIVTIGMAALTVSGGLQAAGKLVSDILQAFGVPKEVADIVAPLIVMVAVCLATFGVATALAPEAIAEEVLEEGAEAASEVAEEAGQSFFQQAKNFLVENNPFNKLSQAGNLTFMAGAQTLGSTGFISALVKAFPVDEKEKEKLTLALGITFSALVALCGIASAGAIFSAPRAAITETSEFLEIMRSPKWGSVLLCFTAAKAAVDGRNASVQFQAAKTQKELGLDRALFNLFKELSNMVNASQQGNTRLATTTMSTIVDANTELLQDENRAQQEWTRALGS